MAPTTPPTPLPPIPGLPVEIAELCMACLDADPEHRPTSFLAAVLLAEAVDATIHLPPVATAAPDEPAPVSPWTRAAAEAVTNHAVDSSEPPAGRHRA
jgi:eukaryotic-like serine/threonine-protein kinase